MSVPTSRSVSQPKESKLGEKNPNYKDGRTCGEKSRIQEVNHKVVSVECLVDDDEFDKNFDKLMRGTLL